MYLHVGLGQLSLWCFKSRLEALANCSYHHDEPIEVEAVKGQVACQVESGEPKWDGGFDRYEGHDSRVLRPGARVIVYGCPYVAKDAYGLIGSVDEAAGEEAKQEHETIVELRARPGHVELVHEPMKIQERG